MSGVDDGDWLGWDMLQKRKEIVSSSRPPYTGVGITSGYLPACVVVISGWGHQMDIRRFGP